MTRTTDREEEATSDERVYNALHKRKILCFCFSNFLNIIILSYQIKDKRDKGGSICG